MNRRIELRLLLGIAVALSACTGGAPTEIATGETTAALSTGAVLKNIRTHVDHETGEVHYSGALCDESAYRHCLARVATDAAGHPLIAPRPGGGGGGGLAPADLQSAYALDVTKNPGATVAIVDAYGYTGLESDLAKYRSMYNLPPCTTANGCLKIVNQMGQTSPLPAEDGQGCNGWAGETSLDVDMVSAACPNCKILVVQTNDADQDSAGNMNHNLEMAQATAASLGAYVISDSWGGADTDVNDVKSLEPYFNVAPYKTGIFVASGDAGWNNAQASQAQGGPGPDYPSTSAYVIGVGGTSLKKSSSGTRGWTETVWSSGGSSCSPVVPIPSYQMGLNTGCTFRAACDIAADADPATGPNTVCGGQAAPVGGTSAASPFAAAVFALYGHAENRADFVYTNKTAWNDVTSGSNGSCGNVMCTAQAGWDGPTGLGTPNGKALGAIAPTDGNPNVTPDMAMSPDMAQGPDMAEGGNGGSGGEGGGGSGGTGTGGNGGSGGTGGNGNNGGGGCSMSGTPAAAAQWIFVLLGAVILGRTLRSRRRS
jgi:hypothetical protein